MIRFGSVLATLNADATAGPSVMPISALRAKPVIREISVAMAIEPVERTTSASLAFPVSADLPASATATAPDPVAGPADGAAARADPAALEAAGPVRVVGG